MGGVHTEVLHLDHARGENPLVQVLIVPGNPGQVNFAAFKPLLTSSGTGLCYADWACEFCIVVEAGLTTSLLLQAMYYTPFMQSLHASLKGRASITAISQLGMAAKQVNPPGKVRVGLRRHGPLLPPAHLLPAILVELLVEVLRNACKAGLQVYTLEEQIEHKAAYLQEQMLGEGKPPVVLLAHSIGQCPRLRSLLRGHSPLLRCMCSM